jgi:cytosine/adenosine deaminase-related metal-dependent hydrolase
MKQSAELARRYGVHLHTHLSETEDEEAFCLQKFGYRPFGYMQSLDWVGEDVWFAHSIYINPEEIQVYARTGCGVAHCPNSNMRLASGIAPIREFLRAKVKVGIGVDGSASNDGSHLLEEVRQAMLLARVRAGIEGASQSNAGEHWIMTARQALELATLGGAAVLGRKDIGSLEIGKCADFIALDLNRLGYAGAAHDPVAAIVFCAPQNVDYNVVGGKFIVKEGRIMTLDLPAHVEKHQKAAKRLVKY